MTSSMRLAFAGSCVIVLLTLTAFADDGAGKKADAAKGALKISSIEADPETIRSGATSKIEAKVSGGGELAYKWEAKNTDTNKDVTSALSSTKDSATTTFTAPDVKATTDFEIKVTVTRGSDKAEDWAVVTVNPKPATGPGSGPTPLPTPGVKPPAK